MQYVVVLTMEDEALDGDDSIEHACSIVNDQEKSDYFSIRPLSEVIAA